MSTVTRARARSTADCPAKHRWSARGLDASSHVNRLGSRQALEHLELPTSLVYMIRTAPMQTSFTSTFSPKCADNAELAPQVLNVPFEVSARGSNGRLDRAALDPAGQRPRVHPDRTRRDGRRHQLGVARRLVGHGLIVSCVRLDQLVLSILSC